MPILAKEPSVYPETLLEDDGESALEGTGCGERQWWLLYTRVKQEKALARQLLNYQIPFYLPLVVRHHVYRGRKVRSHLPLFSGYLFLYADDYERGISLSTNRIAHSLPVADPNRLRYDLQQVNRLIESDAPLTIERRLVPGQRVRIRTGPFAGITGTLTSRRADTKLLVAIDFIGQGVSIEINDFQVEPL